MKKIFTLVLLTVTLPGLAQTTAVAPSIAKAFISHGTTKKIAKDTVIESDTSKENKEPRYFYFSANSNFFVNTKGGVARRFSPAVEFGRTYGIFDIGLATGVFSASGYAIDTAHYLELRPTINVFSSGRFSEGLCLGAGYVFGAKQALVTEICNSINFNISTTLAVAVTQGYVFFDGTNSNRSAQYMGLAFTYNLLRKHSVNNQRKKKAILSTN